MSLLKKMEKDGFKVLISGNGNFLIISQNKTLKEVNDALFSLLKPNHVGFKNENSYKNF